MKKLLPVLSLVLATSVMAAPVRRVDAVYTATIAAVPAGLDKLDVWIPLPQTRGPQTVHNVRIDSAHPFTVMHEKEFGNDYAFVSIPHPAAGDLTVRVNFTAERREESIVALPDTRASKDDLQRALRADTLVTLSPRVRKLADEITAGKSDPLEQAKAIYSYLVVSMKYDKTIPGWGRGDSERACDIRAGNCTDFHSLFISLARAKGIPARFVIGFPMSDKSGVVKGYHCWAEFYVQGKGWIPIDASEASKSNDPGVRQYLFGNLDPDRVQFTVGRDLVLTPRTAQPLNYFIYPHAEANGKEVGTPSISLEFHDVAAAQQTASK